MVWSIRVFQDTVAIRHPGFPNYRLDVTRTEAADLSNELALALNNPVKTPFVVPWRLRFHDWLLLLWTKRQKPMLTKEEAQRLLSGGWTDPTRRLLDEDWRSADQRPR